MPDVALGRLVETPADASAAVDRYVAANGILNPQTAFVTGYDFLSDGAQAVLAALSPAAVPAATAVSKINSTWTRPAPQAGQQSTPRAVGAVTRWPSRE